jgi:hypothetical protein
VLCPASIIVCESDAPFALTGGTPLGGVYSGTGVIGTQMSGYTFNPGVAGDGLHVITYTYTGFDNCMNSCTFNITVNDVTACDITPSMNRAQMEHAQAVRIAAKKYFVMDWNTFLDILVICKTTQQDFLLIVF